MALFKENTVSLEQPIKAGQKSVPVFFEFDDLTKDKIEYNKKTGYQVVPGCTCSADFSVRDDGISISYNDNTSKNNVDIQPKKELTVQKTLRVYLKDGKPMRKKNGRGVMVPNPDKESELLTFIVTVKS